MAQTTFAVGHPGKDNDFSHMFQIEAHLSMYKPFLTPDLRADWFCAESKNIHILLIEK